MSVTIDIDEIASPAGGITLAVLDGRLCALGFTDQWPGLRARLERRFGTVTYRRVDDPSGVAGRLRAYLAGDFKALVPIIVDLGGTPFQRRVWNRLRSVPPGRTISYRDLARAIGAPAAVRAVGAANGANPVSIVVPCHRVVGTDGSLTGYAGGLDRKRWLLTHEGAPRPTVR